MSSNRTDRFETIDLEELNQRYHRALTGVRTPTPFDDHHHRRQYRLHRFVHVDDVISEVAFRPCLEMLAGVLRAIASPVVMTHVVMPDGRLGDGHRFSRVDSRSVSDPDVSRRLDLLLDRIGLHAFGAALAEKLDPLLTCIVGPFRYERVFASIFEEEDYISVHDDLHMGDRVDAHFSASFHATTGLRVLGPDDLFRTYLDKAGAMNVLGPRVWHEVPPVMRADPSQAPLRVTLTLRLASCEGAQSRDAPAASQ